MEEEIDVSFSDYIYVASKFYGHWGYFVVLFFFVIGKYYTSWKYSYLIADWANSSHDGS